jgi:hypothetical protein
MVCSRREVVGLGPVLGLQQQPGSILAYMQAGRQTFTNTLDRYSTWQWQGGRCNSEALCAFLGGRHNR